MSRQVRLPHSLGAGAVLLLTVSATTPASSLFVIVPGMLAEAGNGALLAMLGAGLICLATAFLYAELSSAFPNAGGEYVMVARTLGPAAGFVVMVLNLVNNMLFPPVVGLGLAAVLAGVLPGLPPMPVACLTVLGATSCALLAIRLNALITGVFLLIEMAAIGTVALVAGVHPQRSLSALAVGGAGAIGTATAIAVFALNGYGMAVYFAEEMRDARKRIGRVVLWSFATCFALELVPLAAGLAGAPDLAGWFVLADPFGTLLRRSAGAKIADAAALGVAVSIVNAAIVTVLASARFLYATARDGVWGKWGGALLGRVSGGQQVPWAATLAVGVIGVGCCWVRLRFLLVLSGAGLLATYAALALAALVGRYRATTAHTGYRMPGFPLVPLFTLAAVAAIGWASWLDPVDGRPGLIATLVQVVVALGWYAGSYRRTGWRPRDAPTG